MNYKIENIFFDLDNTLWDFTANSRRVISDLFLEFNLEDRCSTDKDSFLKEYERINLLLWDKFRNSEITKAQLRSSRFFNSMQYFGYEDYELGYKLEEAYVSRSPYQKTLIPGACQVLKKLKEHYKLHIITNGFREVQHLKINNSGIKEYISNIFISEEVGFAKPDKKIFQHSLKISGSRPENSLMVGDDMLIDVLGAKQCGMMAIHFDRDLESESVGGQEIKINRLEKIFQHLS